LNDFARGLLVRIAVSVSAIVLASRRCCLAGTNKNTNNWSGYRCILADDGEDVIG